MAGCRKRQLNSVYHWSYPRYIFVLFIRASLINFLHFVFSRMFSRLLVLVSLLVLVQLILWKDSSTK